MKYLQVHYKLRIVRVKVISVVERQYSMLKLVKSEYLGMF